VHFHEKYVLLILHGEKGLFLSILLENMQWYLVESCCFLAKYTKNIDL